MRRPGFLVLGMVLLLAAEPADKTDAARKDEERLQGTWQLVSLVIDGKKASPEQIKEEHTLVISGHKYVSRFLDQPPHKGTFTLDPTTKPKSVDFKSTEGEFKGKTLQGIYELRGDTLKSCYAPPGKDRPKDFASEPGSGNLLYTYKRAKR
jgi:uncharacterized protein (TIGR03067 family)